MITAAVVCPHPPLLLRELCGRRDTVGPLRAACHEALAAALATGPDAVVVVGAADETAAWDASLPVDVRRFGTTGSPVSGGLPLSLGVASRLLDEVGWGGSRHLHTVRWSASAGEVAEVAGDVTRVGAAHPESVLLVLADGSTRRGEKAPGYLDARAPVFDADVGRALEEADAAALALLDPVLAEELMVLGRAPLNVLGEVTLAQPAGAAGKLLYSDDPHGVQYHVALWRLS